VPRPAAERELIKQIRRDRLRLPSRRRVLGRVDTAVDPRLDAIDTTGSTAAQIDALTEAHTGAQPALRTGRRGQVRFDKMPLQRRRVVRKAIASASLRPLETSDESSTPHLSVVPRRRRAVGIIVACCFVLFALLLGAVAFQTRLAQNQLALDKTEKEVRDARTRYDILRRQRAQLLAPERLAIEAGRLGMAPAKSQEFMTVSPTAEADVMASASGLPRDVTTDHETELDQYGHVKAVAGKTP